MAGKNDLRITVGADIAALIKQMDAGVAYSKKSAKAMADVWRAAMKDLVPPKAAPSPSSLPKAPKPAKPDPTTDPNARANALEAIAIIERKNAEFQKELSGRTTKELIADIDRLQTAKKNAVEAMKLATDKGVKAEQAAIKAGIEAELAQVSAAARKRDDVKRKGAGAGVGLLGIGREITGNLGAALGPAAAVAGIGAAFAKAIGEGSEFQAGVAELSAITGVGGAALDNMASKARALALEFGGSASGNVTAFKGILSKLGPDIAESPVALESMTRAVNTLSAATGDDAAASMDALTTGLLQFQVSLDDPVAAADEMGKMMNVMAAGAKFGAAEVPQISDAIKVAGVAASGAKVSFEETNASLQALAAGGKVGAEAGTALRNVLGKLGEGRFLPKEVQAELKTAGVDINKLGDTSLSLTDRLRELNKISGDAALTQKLFGTENAAAAQILIRSTDSIDDLTGKITGTSVATEQAAINQATFAAGMERFKALMSEIAISIFNAIGPGLAAGLNVLSGSLSTIAPVIVPLIGLVGALGAAVAAHAAYTSASTAGTVLFNAVQSAAAIKTKLVTAAQWLWNTALLANPIGLVVAGAVALVGVIVAVTGAMDNATEKQIELNDAEKAGLEAQIKSNQAAQSKARSIEKAATEYERLATKAKRSGDEERRLNALHGTMVEAYPKLVDSTKSYSGSLDGVKKAAQQAKDDLVRLGKEMDELNTQMVSNSIARGRITVNEVAGSLGSVLSALDFKDSDFDVETRFKRIGGIIDDIKSSAGLSAFGADMKRLDAEMGKIFDGVAADDGGDKTKAVSKLLAIKSALFDLNSLILKSKDTTAEGPVVPDPTATTTTTPAEAKPDAITFEQERIDAVDAAAKARREIEIAAAKDEQTRLTATFKDRFATLETAQKRELEQLEKKRDDSTKGDNPGGFDPKSYDAALTAIRDRQKVDTEKLKQEQTDALTDLAAKRIESELAMASAAATARKEAAQGELDTLIAHQEALGLVTSEGLAARHALEEKVRAADRELLIADRVSKNAEFQQEFAAQNARFDKEEDTVEQHREKLAEIRARFSGIVEKDSTVGAFDAQTTTKALDDEKKLRIQKRREVVAAIKDIDQQARESALLEVEIWLEEELRLATGNAAKRAALETEAVGKRLKIEMEYLDKTNALHSISLSIRDALNVAFTKKVDAERRKDIAAERAKLQQEEADLLASLARRQISVQEYNDKINQIDDRRRELGDASDEASFNFWKTLQASTFEAGKAATEAFEKDRVATSTKSLGELNAITDERTQYIITEMAKGATAEEAKMGATARFEEKINEKRSAAITDMAATATAGLLSALASGENASKRFGSFIFDMVEQAIPSLISLIFGQAIATLGPVAGPIVSGALTATLLGLVSIARSASGFRDGGYTGDGNPNAPAGVVHKGEFVNTAQTTRRHRPALTALHKGDVGLAARLLSSSAVDPLGKLITAPQAQISAAVLETIAHGATTSARAAAREEVASHLTPLTSAMEEMSGKLDALNALNALNDIKKTNRSIDKTTGAMAKHPTKVAVNVDTERATRDRIRRGG